ncbi:MAG TPA: PAS domain-containing sensor histidine kinase [Clostridiales bacterium]|nr:PAS domain-containing sensor histidine kinase [Clostridiales bacterium]
MKKRIFLYSAAFMTVAVILGGLFVSKVSSNVYQNKVESFLLSSANMIVYQMELQSQNELMQDFDPLAVKYSKLLSNKQDKVNPDVHVTFTDYNGDVLGRSSSLFSIENQITKKEISDAIFRKYGRSIRIDKRSGVRYLHIALPHEPSETVVRISVSLAYITTLNRSLFLYTFIAIIIGLLLAFLASRKFNSTVILPIKRLIQVSTDIAEGDYSKRVTLGASDELGKLEKAFNQMAEETDHKVHALTEKNTRVISTLNSIDHGILALDKDKKILFINLAMARICELKDSERECVGCSLMEVFRNVPLSNIIHETYRDNSPKSQDIQFGLPETLYLKVSTNPINTPHDKNKINGVIVTIQDVTTVTKLEKMRTQFVSNVTHELKTPLTSIRGFIETLRAGAINDAEVAEQFLDIIDIEADRLSILINDILQLSEIESIKDDVQMDYYALRELFLDVLPVLEKAAEPKNVQIHEQIDDTIIMKVNPGRIKQLFMNLVDNAIKYNKDSGEIWVRAYQTEGVVVLKVKDNGIGIPKEHHVRIFERFYRVDKGRSREMGGTGLGLSIIKHIVNLYNGSIKMTSNPGEGTEFVIRLPL